MRTLAPRQAPLAEAPFRQMTAEVDLIRLAVALERSNPGTADLKDVSLRLESLRVQLMLLDRAAS